MEAEICDTLTKNIFKKKEQKQKTVGLSEEVWVPVAPSSAGSLIWFHHLPASLIPDQRTSNEDEAKAFRLSSGH